MKDMPPVAKCDVNNCFFNRNNNCHAPAINIGGDKPICDTFIAEGHHINRSDMAMVGACHVRDCRWNKDMLCNAQGITVSLKSGEADCVTFEKL